MLYKSSDNEILFLHKNNQKPQKDYKLSIIFNEHLKISQLLNFAEEYGLKTDYDPQKHTYENISEEIYHHILEIYLYKTKNIIAYGLEAISKMISLSCPKFIMKNRADITSRILFKINNLLEDSYSNIHDNNREQLDEIIPILEGYNKIISSLIYNRKLKFLIDNFYYMNSKADKTNRSEMLLSPVQKDTLINSETIKNLRKSKYMDVNYLCTSIASFIEELSKSETLKNGNIFIECDNLIFTNSNRILDNNHQNLTIESKIVHIESRDPMQYSHSFTKLRSITCDFKIVSVYENARLISIVATDADNINKMNSFIAEIKSYYQSEAQPHWEITYSILKELIIKAVGKDADIDFKEKVINFVGEIAVDSRYSEEVRDIAVEALVYAESLHDDALQNLAVDKIEHIYTFEGKNDEHEQIEDNSHQTYQNNSFKTMLLNEANYIVGMIKALAHSLPKAQGCDRNNIAYHIQLLIKEFDLIETELTNPIQSERLAGDKRQNHGKKEILTNDISTLTPAYSPKQNSQNTIQIKN